MAENKTENSGSNKDTVQNLKKKNNKKKALIIVLSIVSVLLIVGIVLILLLVVKVCKKPDEPHGKYLVTITQPDQTKAPGWIVYANGHTDKFWIDDDEWINVVVSDHGNISNNSPAQSIQTNKHKNEYQQQYVCEVEYGTEKYWDTNLAWNDEYQYYTCSFKMVFEHDIKISIKAKNDLEQFYYFKRNDETWIFDDSDIVNSDVEDVNIYKFDDHFPSQPTIETIKRSTFDESTVYVGSKINNIPDSFMSKFISFNKPITFNKQKDPSTQTEKWVLSYIGELFLNGCEKFDQQIDLPDSLTIIKGDFLKDCYTYNQPLNMKNVEYLNYNADGTFLYRCYSFNSELKMPKVKQIPNAFMTQCIAFNQPLEIPASVENILGNFMFNCDNMTNVLTINCPSSAFAGKERNRVCSTENINANCYTKGILISGTSADAWLEWLKNPPPSSMGIYRKLVKVS